MKIIFLDIDGVLNSTPFLDKALNNSNDATAREQKTLEILKDIDGCHPSFGLRSLRSIDTKPVSFLNMIAKRSGAKFVISSSWRHTYTYKEIGVFLKHHGFMGEVIGSIPNRIDPPKGVTSVKRRHEIQAYLDLHPEIVEFVILDDNVDMGHLNDHFIMTDINIGLETKHIVEALSILKSIP